MPFCVQDLMRAVDGAEIIARAVYTDDLAKDEEQRRNWLEKYCMLYQELVTVSLPAENKDPIVVFVSREEGVDVFAHELSDTGQNPVRYAVEYLPPEEYAAMLIPPQLLTRYTAEYLASEILREYGWNGVEIELNHPLVLYRQAKRHLQEWNLLGEEHWQKLQKLVSPERCLSQMRPPKTLLPEHILESAKMPFDLYHRFCKDQEKMLVLRQQIRTNPDRILKNLDFLRQSGYSDREIAQIAFHGFWLLGCAPEQMQQLLTRRGSWMTRYLLDQSPKNMQAVLAKDTSPELLPPLRCSPCKEVFAFARAQERMVELSASGAWLHFLTVVCVTGDQNGGTLYAIHCEENEPMTIPFSRIAWVSVTDHRAYCDEDQRDALLHQAEKDVNGAYFIR